MYGPWPTAGSRGIAADQPEWWVYVGVRLRRRQDDIDAKWAALRAATQKRASEIKATIRYIQVTNELSDFDTWLKEMEDRAAEDDGTLVHGQTAIARPPPDRVVWWRRRSARIDSQT